MSILQIFMELAIMLNKFFQQDEKGILPKGFLPEILQSQYPIIQKIPDISLRLHLLALAINRVLAVYFPFWYERKIKFR
jgi:hypothetical protein